MIVCGCCEAEAVARIEASTSHGVGSIDVCEKHVIDGFMAAQLLSPRPQIIINDVSSVLVSLVEFLQENPECLKLSSKNG